MNHHPGSIWDPGKSGRGNSRGKGQEAAMAGGQCAPEEGGQGSREGSQQGFADGRTMWRGSIGEETGDAWGDAPGSQGGNDPQKCSPSTLFDQVRLRSYPSVNAYRSGITDNRESSKWQQEEWVKCSLSRPQWSLKRPSRKTR